MFGGNKEPSMTFMSKNVIHSTGDLVFLVFNSVYSTLQNQIWVPKGDVMYVRNVLKGPLSSFQL